jgi:branched-chain amino acid transport system substrate-binding protein
MADTVVYNRGLLQASIQVEAIKNALVLSNGAMPTREQIKQGLEQFHDVTLGGLIPPLQITSADHEGGGWVQVFAVHDGHFVKQTEWFHAYRDVVDNAVHTAE